MHYVAPHMSDLQGKVSLEAAERVECAAERESKALSGAGVSWVMRNAAGVSGGGWHNRGGEGMVGGGARAWVGVASAVFMIEEQ